MSGDEAFLVDANVFIQAHQKYYGLDLNPGFWDAIGHFCSTGRLMSLDRVWEELKDMGDELTEWASEAPTELFAKSGTEEVVARYRDIMNWVSAATFTDAAKADFAGGADGWLIAFSLVHEMVLVTLEQPSPEAKKRVPIPTVCEQFGVTFIDTFAMLRQLEIRFRWEG